jgi:hypothetical protein
MPAERSGSSKRGSGSGPGSSKGGARKSTSPPGRDAKGNTSENSPEPIEAPGTQGVLSDPERRKATGPGGGAVENADPSDPGRAGQGIGESTRRDETGNLPGSGAGGAV